MTDELRSPGITSDYSSGKAMVGVPVTFTAKAVSGGSPLTYVYSIDQKEVQRGGDALTVTFSEVGTHTVTVVISDIFGKEELLNFDYNVVEPYSTEKPAVSSCYMDNNGTVTVGAIGGTAPYDFTFRIYLKGNERLTAGSLNDYRLMNDPNTGLQYLLQDEKGKNTSLIPFACLNENESYQIVVQAADAAGEVSEPEILPYKRSRLIY